MEYGSGKLEQVGNVVIGSSMLLAGGWVAMGAIHIVVGHRHVGTPASLAFAPMSGMFNVYINVLAWQGVRRATENSSSLLMDAQVHLRKVKLGRNALEANRADYVRVERMRTRRSRRMTFIEIALGVDMNLSMSEVHDRIEMLKATIRRDVEDADISIVTSPAPATS